MSESFASSFSASRFTDTFTDSGHSDLRNSLLLKQQNLEARVGIGPTHRFRGTSPTSESSKVTCWAGEPGVKSEEMGDARPVLRGWMVLVLFPFLDGGVGDSEFQQFGQLRHGKTHIDALLPQMLPDGLGVGRIMPGSHKVRGNGRFLMMYGAPVDSQQVECAASKVFCPLPSARGRRARPACSS